MKLIPFIVFLLSFALQGCVGGMYLHEKSETYEADNFYLEDINVCKLTRAKRVGESDRDYLRYSCDTPTSTETIGEEEVWVYQGHDGWSGVVAFLIIPIPLIAPSGHRDVIINFKDGDLTKVEKQYSSQSNAMCGFLFGFHSIEFGCSAK